MKLPLMLSDARVAYHCPEIRKGALLVMVLRPMHKLSLLLSIIVGAPFAMIYGLGYIMMSWSDPFLVGIKKPSRSLKRLIVRLVNENHEILSIEEIRRRLYGEDKTGDVSSHGEK